MMVTSGDRRTVPTSTDLKPVTDLLGPDVAAVLADVAPAAQLRLLGQIEAAQARQADLIEAAVQTAVKGVPLPVRGIVKKALIG